MVYGAGPDVNMGLRKNAEVTVHRVLSERNKTEHTEI